MQPALGEFDLIRQYFSDIGPRSAEVQLSVGDDCALLSVPAGRRLAISIDTLIAGRHFPEEANAKEIATRALAVAISDLAAMGATPLAFTLAIALPQANSEWLSLFSAGLAEAADFYGIPLVGGDTTKGPLTITVQVHGSVAGNGLQRSAAQAGDSIFVTGFLGDAAAALAVIRQEIKSDTEQTGYLLDRFYRPEARVVLGQQLLGIANAAIDISDGLVADLGHIARASALAADIQVDTLPLSPVLKAVVSEPQARQFALTGGDDYELCLTVSQNNKQQLLACCRAAGVKITEIGTITPGAGVSCINGDGKPLKLSRSGYQHF